MTDRVDRHGPGHHGTPTVSGGTYGALMDDNPQKPNPGRGPARSRTAQGAAPPGASEADGATKGIALYHDMRVEEDFAKCASRLFSTLRHAAASDPGAPRHLFLDIQGHPLGGSNDVPLTWRTPRRSGPGSTTPATAMVI